MGRWQERWTQLGRDMDVLRRRARGQRLSPVVRDVAIRFSPARPALGALPYRIVRTVRETADATSLYLARVDGEAVPFRAGQFLSFDVTLETGTVRRAYSIAAAEGDALHVTVKRVEGGAASPRLVDAQSGDVLHARGPSGDFGLEGAPSGVFIAGGSGITPIIAMLETLLARDDGHALLIYANQREASVIFAERLKALEARFPSRLRVVHVLEHGSNALGRLDASSLGALLDEHEAHVKSDAPAYLCGPAAMMDALRERLQARLGSLHEESFLSARVAPRDGSSGVFTLRVANHEASVRANQTLLEAGLDAGIALPFSCAVGGCAACKVRLVEGSADMDEPNCLTDAERDEGYILTCCSRATSDCVLELPS